MEHPKRKEYIISEKDLLELLEDHYRLTALEQGGVDNWTWYSDSCADFINDYVHENDIDFSEDSDIEDFWFSDIAKIEVEQYPIYKSMFER